MVCETFYIGGLYEVDDVSLIFFALFLEKLQKIR